MGFVRPHLAVVLLGAALFTARPALSGPSLTDHLTSGAAQVEDPARPGEGGLLVAGPHGASYELRGGALLEVSAGAAFAFEPSIRLKLRKPGDPDTFARSVRLARGQATVTIPAKYKDQTAVLFRGAGKLSAVAKEGVSTFVTDDDRTTAASRSGEMLVGIGNEWKALREGFARTIDATDPGALPRPILAAPTARTDRALIVVDSAKRATFSATWTEVKDAKTYEVTLANAISASVVARLPAPTTTAAWNGLPPGAYSVSVVAVDRFGLMGSPSKASSVHVVGLVVPDGATVTNDGAVLLGHDQRVSLTGPSNLEVSYGASALFQPAPSTLGLAHGAPTLVRLRAPGTSDETAIRLEPTGLRANVAIGPKVARWPLDQVVVDVELYDANGRAVPEDSDVSPTITVNLDPVKVKWTRKGRTLHTELPAGTAPGPWVVRVEVRDHRGDLIGRNFLEVASNRSRGTADVTASR
jgi:hypothetical protein